MATTLSLGDEFETFSGLELRVKEYEKVTYTKFCRQDSRTVAAHQRRRARNINIKEELVYGEATYCCKQEDVNSSRRQLEKDLTHHLSDRNVLLDSE